MTGFSADWLALREPFDAAARLVAWPVMDLSAHAGRWRAAPGAPDRLSVLDLGCGTGANLRTMAPRISGAQRWLLADHDPALLAAVPHAMAAWAQSNAYHLEARNTAEPTAASVLHIVGSGFDVELRCLCIDLVDQLERVDWATVQLVTACALLDLVSARWLDGLIHRASRTGAALLFALDVDGRLDWEPSDPGDGLVHRLFSGHQLRDKGLGPALGAAAVAYAHHALEASGYATAEARSDWCIDGAAVHTNAPAMLAAMIDGMATAALEQHAGMEPAVLAWKARRLAAVRHSRLTVGHVDLLGIRRTSL